MIDSVDFGALRDQVRSDRHATSYPLVVVGAVGFHYVSFNFSSDWVPWWYGLPLAFVVIWALQWKTERLHGVGSGHDEVLMIAFAVFLGTSLVASETWASIIPSSSRQYPSVYLLPTVVGLGAIAWRQHNRTLAAWTVVLVTGLAFGAVFRDSSLGWFDAPIPYQTFLPQLAFLGTVAAGLVQFRTEASAIEP